jgi:hypothetical protein
MQLVSDMKSGKGWCFNYVRCQSNVHSAKSKEFADGLKKTELSISFSMKEDETALNVNILQQHLIT